MHTASQALAIERQASAQPSLAERVSRPKTRAILGLMRLNFLSVDQGSVVPNPLGSNKPNLNAPVDPGSGNAPVSNSPPEQQLAVVNRNLANQGYGLTTSGNLYTMTTSSATNVQNAAMADAGNGPPPASISAEVKALAARGQELQQQVAAAK